MRFSVVTADEVFDFGDQFFNAAEGSATDGLLGDDVKPDFHLVEPGRVGRSEVHVIAGPRCQPDFAQLAEERPRQRWHLGLL